MSGLLFMLDTDSVSYALRGEGQVNDRIVRHLPTEICISAITLAELRHGAHYRRSAKIHRSIDRILSNFKVVAFDQSCAEQFGIITSELKRLGEPISKFDALIAAHALALNVTLVTNNIKHFARVPGLRVENWL